MKSIKLLAALAVPAMFAACSNEELVIMENTQQGMDEVVGVELIGSNITMSMANLGTTQTRWADGVASWDKEDKLGIGWITKTGPSTPQDVSVAPDLDKLYANHLFEVNADNKFETKGNLYKGWHFAYYPFAYQETIGEKVIEVNPEQTLDLIDRESGKTNAKTYYQRFSQQFHVSALQFLTREKLTDDYQLKPEVNLNPTSPLARIVIFTNPVAESQIEVNPNLQKYEISSITINAGKEVFAPYAKLAATKLHQYNENIEFAEGGSVIEANKAKLVESFTEAIIPYKSETEEGRVSSMTTTLNEEAGYTVGEKTLTAAYVLPMSKAEELDAKEVTIEVVAGGGRFVIDYEETSTDAWDVANKKAIDNLVAAYKTDGDLLLANGEITLNLQLHETDFVAVWDGIMTDEDWNKKFQLATDLGIADPTFTLASGAAVEFKSTTLTPANKGEGLANVVKSVTVLGEKTDGDYDSQIIIAEDMTWDNSIIIPKDYIGEEGTTVNNKAVGVVINAGKTLSVEGTEAEPYDFKPFRIKNNGTIKVNGWASVGQKGYNNLDNSEGRIEIQYGAYVYPATNKAEGVIAYRVTDADTKSPENIRILTSKEWSKGWANVNTLIIDKDINLDLSKKADKPNNTEGDRYQNATNGTIEGEEYPSLAKINIEINGGTFSKATGEIASVNNVTINGGSVAGKEGALTNIAILGKLTINNGTVNVHTVNSIEIQGGVNDITTAHSISGGLIANGENTIKVSGTVIGDVTLNGDDYVEVDAIKGNVTITGENNTLICGKVMGSVTVNGTADLNNVAAIEGDLNVAENANLTVNSEENVSVANIKNEGKMTVNAYMTVKDITLTEPSETYVTSGFAVLYSGEFVNDGLRRGQINKDENAVVEDEPVLITSLEDFQNALNAATEGTTVIALGADIKGDVIVTQKEGVNIVIDGGKYKYNGTLYIYGNSRFQGAETLTIKNVKFYTETKELLDFISSNSKDSDKRYAHNVTIENCTFEGSAETVVGMRLRQAYNILVKDCEATELHSLSQNTSCSYQKYENCTVSAGGGINILTSGNVDVVDCNFTATEDDGYGIRVDAKTSGNVLNVSGSTIINAYEPVVFRQAKTEYKFNLASGSTLNTLSGNHIVVQGEQPTMTGVEGLTILNR